jgi:hypothetical protein
MLLKLISKFQKLQSLIICRMSQILHFKDKYDRRSKGALGYQKLA